MLVLSGGVPCCSEGSMLCSQLLGCTVCIHVNSVLCLPPLILELIALFLQFALEK